MGYWQPKRHIYQEGTLYYMIINYYYIVIPFYSYTIKDYPTCAKYNCVCKLKTSNQQVVKIDGVVAGEGLAAVPLGINLR